MNIRITGLITAMLITINALANNVTVSDVVIYGTGPDTATVKFDVQWENSWRYAVQDDPLYFHDATWIFFKVQKSGESEWLPLILEHAGINPQGSSTGTGDPAELLVPSDLLGVFVRRSEDGDGSFSAQDIKVVCSLAANELTKTDQVKIRAFAQEMVYVPKGSFKVGDGLSDAGQLFEGGGNKNPFEITGAGPIETGNSANMLWGASQSGKSTMGGAGTIPAAFPNGYNAFYCMKYEITQGQYADFLNTLTRNQQATRCTANKLNYYMTTSAGGSSVPANRNTVRVIEAPVAPKPLVFEADRPDRGCNWLSWPDVAAFADWAALRPITELEFEKACRGPLEPVSGEFAWGTATIMPDASRTLSGEEDGTETILSDTSLGGCNYGGKAHIGGDAGQGALRAGIFADNNSTRIQAGAGYWGIFELSGGCWERGVSIGS
ncbi:MAG: SUMF1/EgtB/PvdO family nonheme iron enzyme, partial [Lentisphaerae bacterium]|nr:SUMF1/EgtB/PvdO family nonheme iron enzyme [Lentisphaerota bacterium]